MRNISVRSDGWGGKAPGAHLLELCRRTRWSNAVSAAIVHNNMLQNVAWRSLQGIPGSRELRGRHSVNLKNSLRLEDMRVLEQGCRTEGEMAGFSAAVVVYLSS